MRGWRHRIFWAGLVAALPTAACRAQTDRPPDAPVAVVDDAGRSVALAAPARRVASLLPSFTELLFAIGAGDRLVARTAWCDYPAAARTIPNVGDGIPPSVEAVAARTPDLVVLYHSGPNVSAAAQLERLGIATVLFDLNRLDDLGRVARALGRLVGRPDAADSLARALADLAPAPQPPAGSRSLVFVVWDNPPVVIGAGSYLDQLAALSGLRNVFHDVTAPSAQVSIETIAARNPDFVAVIIESESEGAPPPIPGFAARPEWRVVPAVRANRFLLLGGGLFGRPGPRAPLAVAELRRLTETAP
jgi:ABC-type Fe3+-hydroxamate transport system substrate-binding protein